MLTTGAKCAAGHETACAQGTFTYNSKHPDGGVAYGGYADSVRVPSEFAFTIPANLSSAEAAPLLCAGATVWAPLKHNWVPKARVGVVGIGGLGHIAVMFAKALGASEVVAITTSDRKSADAVKLGATKILISTDPAAMKAAVKSLDIIICTANAHDIAWESYLSLLDFRGKFVLLGLPEQPISLNVGALIIGNT